MFCQEFADCATGFIQCLKHTDGKWHNRPFLLLEWQKQAVGEFYGTIRPNGLRQYEYLYLEIPKKNGKSELAAALGLYHTFMDGEMHGEIYICATDRQNASIVFNVALGMIELCKPLKKRCTIRASTREIVDRVSGSVMKVLSAEAFSKHGYKPSCVIFDELHAQPNRDLWDVMTFGAGDARAQPVWIVLTTAGNDPDRSSIGWEQHEKARSILNYRSGQTEGNYDDPSWLPFIYGMPDDPDECEKVDIYDESLWFKCNPSLGLTIDIEKVRQEAADAKRIEAKERLFRWLRLNQWIAVKSVGWLPLTLFDKTTKNIPLKKLAGKKCYGGLDLSSTTDLTAFVLLFPPQEGLKTWHVLFKAWVPKDKIQERERTDHQDFSGWVKKGYLNATPGNAVDYDQVEADIAEAARLYQIILIGTDKWHSLMINQHLQSMNIVMVEIGQSMAGMSPAMKSIEWLLLKKSMTHEKNPCARWCFGNTRCAVDGNENTKPMKNRSTGRIDITVAWINAMAAAIEREGIKDISKTILSEDWSL